MSVINMQCVVNICSESGVFAGGVDMNGMCGVCDVCVICVAHVMCVCGIHVIFGEHLFGGHVWSVDVMCLHNVSL